MYTSINELVNVVIPCKNEEDYIGNILSDLNKEVNFISERFKFQSYEPLKVFIADANSTDTTLEVIEECKIRFSNLDIKVIKGGRVSYGRNEGAKLCNSKFISFIDADTRLLTPGTLSASFNVLLADPSKKLLTCKLKSYSKSALSKLAFRSYNIVHSILKLKYPFAIGAYFFVDRESFESFGRFNENSDNSEDFLFSQNYRPDQFVVLDMFIGQDDRRFKQMGYLGMGWHLIRNLLIYIFNGRTEFTKDRGYWKV